MKLKLKLPGSLAPSGPSGPLKPALPGSLEAAAFAASAEAQAQAAPFSSSLKRRLDDGESPALKRVASGAHASTSNADGSMPPLPGVKPGSFRLTFKKPADSAPKPPSLTEHEANGGGDAFGRPPSFGQKSSKVRGHATPCDVESQLLHSPPLDLLRRTG